MIPLQSNHPISTLVSILFTMQWSIVMNNPTPKSIIQLLSETILFHSVFSITLLPTPQIPTTWSRVCDHWIITYLAMGKPQITPNYCYSTKQIQITSLNEDIKKSWIWLTDYTICGKWNATLSIWGCAEYKPNQCKIWDIDRRLVMMKRLFMIIP